MNKIQTEKKKDKRVERKWLGIQPSNWLDILHGEENNNRALIFTLNQAGATINSTTLCLHFKEQAKKF